MVRVRHYTRVSSMRRIVAERRLVARDPNKVFVEPASSRRLSPADAADTYGLDEGKGKACVEFDVPEDELKYQWNARFRVAEWFIVGDIELTERNTEAFFNH